MGTSRHPQPARLAAIAQAIPPVCLEAYPQAQAVYLFGSWVEGTARPDSDCDVALLLPPTEARRAGVLALSPLRVELERRLGLEVDLVNLRLASTVLAKEVVTRGERIHAADLAAADAFEALTLSLYQELNLERAEVLRDFERTGRAFGA